MTKEIKVGPPGTKSYYKAIRQVKELIDYAQHDPELNNVLEFSDAGCSSNLQGRENDRPIEIDDLKVKRLAMRMNSIMRNKSSSYRHTSEHESVVIPCSWFQHILTEYRGGMRPHYRAILVLGHIVYRYRATKFSEKLFWLDYRDLATRFGMTKNAVKDVMRFLSEAGYIIRISIKGTVPWCPDEKARGSYIYVLPVLHKIEKITYKPSVNS